MLPAIFCLEITNRTCQPLLLKSADGKEFELVHPPSSEIVILTSLAKMKKWEKIPSDVKQESWSYELLHHWLYGLSGSHQQLQLVVNRLISRKDRFKRIIARVPLHPDLSNLVYGYLDEIKPVTISVY
jgi:hypothetical protein